MLDVLSSAELRFEVHCIFGLGFAHGCFKACGSAGGGKVYVKSDGPLTYPKWVAAYKAGHL